MSDPKGFPSLKAFLDSVNSAKYAEISARAESKVTHEDALGEMQAHILRLYDKTEALHSFTDEGGGVFDCIPIEQQPGLRGQPGLSALGTIPEKPDLKPIEAAGGAQDERKPSLIVSPFGLHRTEGFAWECKALPAGNGPHTQGHARRYGPIRHLARFFCRKDPRGAGRPPQASIPPGVQARIYRRWAHAFQNVNNNGGHSFLNLWDPAIGANQIFSLSQHWYVGGSGASLCRTSRRMLISSLLPGLCRKRASAFVHLLDRR